MVRGRWRLAASLFRFPGPALLAIWLAGLVTVTAVYTGQIETEVARPKLRGLLRVVVSIVADLVAKVDRA